MAYKAYKYLYYRIYAWNLRMWGESDLPKYNTLFGVSLLICFNIMTLATLVEVLVGNHLPDSNVVSIGLLGIFIAVLLVSYYLLVHNGKYRTIVKEFNRETPVQRRKRLAAILLYVIGSLVTFFGVVQLRNH